MAATTSRFSRFPIHDELTAPEGSVPVLRGALSSAGQLPNVIGVLAGAPAALRGFARFRAELRRGHLRPATLERIGLAVAEHHGSAQGVALHTRTGRAAGLGVDDIALAREFDAYDPAESVLLRYLRAVLDHDGPPAQHLHEEARERGWTDEQLLEAIAHVALESFTAMVQVAGDVPADGSVEASRQLPAAA